MMSCQLKFRVVGDLVRYLNLMEISVIARKAISANNCWKEICD